MEPEVTEENSVMSLTLKDGTKIPVNAKTIYTKHSNGRVDCKIELQKPLDMSGKSEKT